MAADSQYEVVHELTKDKGRYGCRDREEFAHGYIAPDRIYNGRTYRDTVTFIPHAMSRDCRNFYLWDTDPKCVGCTTPKDTAYAERMKGMQ